MLRSPTGGGKAALRTAVVTLDQGWARRNLAWRIEVAARLARRIPDGVWAFSKLSAVTDPAAVHTRGRRVLGIHPAKTVKAWRTSCAVWMWQSPVCCVR